MDKKPVNINVEQCLISGIILAKDLNTAIENGITPKYFTGRYKEAFKYILTHSTKYGRVVSSRLFQKDFPDIELVSDTGEPMLYWCDAVKNKRKHNLMADKLEETYRLVEDLKTEEAFNTLKSLVMQVESEVQTNDRQSVNKNTGSRRDDYRARQISGGITGIPSAINEWDKLTGGDNKGELHTYMAYTGVGKTWWLVINAVHQAKDGFKVLMITTEMSTKLMMRRIDAVWCALNYTRFKKGQLLPDEEKRFFKYLDDMENNEETYLEVVQATGGITQVSAEIDRAEPDVVYIDGAYLLEDEEYGEDNWAGVLRIWRGLHKLCLAKDVPIKVTTQSKDETNAKLSSLAFAKAISNECMPEDTLILTSEGYEKIQDLVDVNFKVFDGFKTKNAICVKTGKKQVLQINYLGNTFECSPNHLVGVYDDLQGALIYKRAKDIKVGTDYLIQYSKLDSNADKVYSRLDEARTKFQNMQDFHFVPIDSIVITDLYVDMYDIKVTNSDDKSLIANGIVTHNCDIVAVLEQDEQMKNDREVKLKPLKLREGDILVSIVLNWDFNEMDYSPIYKENIKEEANAEELNGVIVIDEEE